MRIHIVIACLLLHGAMPVVAQHVAQSAPQVKTANGIIEGVLEKSGIHAFKGVPFAAPPVGALRWKAPAAAANWEGVRMAKKFAPKPMQTNVFGDMNSRADSASEDCLYLNVWAPAPAKGKALLPVLVYFYGGGFVAGDASEPRYDGESMARQGIVALTVNYRLGVFGFLAHSELSTEAPYHASGNYGLLDQAAALQWVHDNIAAFGGDPKRVTIAGESAGSVSVSAQMISPLSRDFIAGAIGESGSLLGTLRAVSLQEGEHTGAEFATAAGKNSLEDLRAMPADALLQAAAQFGVFRFSSVVDRYFFPTSPYAMYDEGQQAQVPLLVGWNNLEMGHQMILGQEKPTKENYEKAVQRLYGNKATDVLKLYKATTDDEVIAAADDLAGDRFIGFSTWKWSNVHINTSNKPVYRYIYERARPEMVSAMGNVVPGLAGGVQKSTTAVKPPPARGAVHSAEIEYAMGNLATNKVYAWTKEDYAISQVMQAYFANFIKTGNPNGKGLPAWPIATSQTPVQVMHINVQSAAAAEQHRDRYLFMDEQAAGK
ncbi:para-nitrobenzyl esterase [Filimonas lacunae]|uniref:Carboxylic ester hydrolase n=1 Tax=Filimonas lacunae TaxID=477680 RepID=A0A173MCQ5_9BACT|nr:carboxylesterase family protein [Filimonas lacunae]BAV05300.1 carboxylesterase [Filimonas lacunae]SIT22101.1 para-nitrobenzyl esterase [Filimonas lacunae]